MNRYRVVFRVPVQVFVIAESAGEATASAERWLDTLLPKLVETTEAWQLGSGTPMGILAEDADIADVEVQP